MSKPPRLQTHLAILLTVPFAVAAVPASAKTACADLEAVTTASPELARR